MQFELPFQRVAHVAAGARAAEAELLDRIEGLVEGGRRDPALLARPVRVVVPSKSLRLGVSAAIVRRLDRSVLGVVVQTLFGAAYEVLEQAGAPVKTSGALVDVLVRRAAREEPALRDALDPLVDGYAAVRRSVRELLDAGLTADEAGPLLDVLEGAHRRLRPGELRRATALLRTAAATDEGLAERGLDRGSTVLRRATAILRAGRGGPGALNARAVLLFGFDDVDGLSSAFLEELARRPGAVAVLDHPPDPADPSRPDAGAVIARRLTDRLGAATGGAVEAARRAPPPTLRAFVAEGPWGEATEVARRVRRLLDGAGPPERIAVVARDLGRYAAPLRVLFERHGIPWSGVAGQAPPTPDVRWRGLSDLLTRREALPTDAWLELLGVEPVVRTDLRLAFRALGAARLGQAARTSLRDRLRSDGGFALPVSEGLEASGDGEGARGRRRRLDGAVLEDAVAAAGALAAWCRAWPERGELADYVEALWELLDDVLRVPPGDDPAGPAHPASATHPARAAVAALEQRYEPTLELHEDEIAVLLGDALRGAGDRPIGGRGGGVQVLTAGEARGRTFEHLFVLGLNRGLFPPPVTDDALLTAGVRELLRPALPELAGRDDPYFAERYRFAGLLSSAPLVTLSWQSSDGDGKVLAVSPLVERMRWEGTFPEAAGAIPRTEGPPAAPRPPSDHALSAALQAPRRTLTGVLTEALEDARPALPHGALLPGAGVVAAGRQQVVDELDPDLGTDGGQHIRSRPGPYLGLVGPAGAGAGGDPRLRTPSVSFVEAVASCPWQALLRRLLRIERVPDPLAAVPRADNRVLGMLVHRILERIVERVVPRSKTLAEAVERAALAELDGVGDRGEGRPAVPWPSRPELTALARAEAARLLRDEGVSLPGLADMLARQVRPPLEVARRLDWGEADALPAIATEVSGTVTVGGRRLAFRADRVDLRGDRVVLTDYKAGKPFAFGATTHRRRAVHLDQIARGRRLQAAVYASADGVQRPDGRFLFLKPEVEDGPRVLVAAGADDDFKTALHGALEAILGAVEAGVLFPRLVDPDGRNEPRPCRYCDVAEACLRGDSGVRGRLVRWSQAQAHAEAGGAELEGWRERFGALWRLPDARFVREDEDDGFGFGDVF